MAKPGDVRPVTVEGTVTVTCMACGEDIETEALLDISSCDAPQNLSGFLLGTERLHLSGLVRRCRRCTPLLGARA